MSWAVAFRRPLRYVLWPAAFVLGVVAEWIGRPELVLLDAVTGFVLLGLGLAAWSRRPRWRVGPILGIAGVAWFIGSLWFPAIYLHRGPLAHLLLSYPAQALLPTSRLDRTAIGAAYAYAAAYPLAANDYVTIAFAFGLVAPVSASGRRGGACSAPAAAGLSYGGHRVRARPYRGGRGAPRRGGGRPHNARRLRPYGVSDRARAVRGSPLGGMGTGDGDRARGRPG